MKKALIQILVIPLITLLGVIVNALFLPYYGSGQLPPDKKIVEDSTMSLDEVKEIIKTAAINEAIVKGMEAAPKVKEKPKPDVIYRTKKVPVVVTRVDTFYKVVEKPVLIYTSAPVYKPDETKYLTFSQWRDSTGEKSEKKYKAYLKNLNVIK